MAVLPKGRVMGIDAGMARTGVAMSDADGFLASALCTIKANGVKDLAAQIAEKATSNAARLIVVGHPINMNGTLGESSARAHRRPSGSMGISCRFYAKRSLKNSNRRG